MTDDTGAAPTAAPCPPWCEDHAGDARLHRSAHKRIIIGRHERGFLASYVLALAEDPAALDVSIAAVHWGERGLYLPVRTAEAAEQYAVFIERLALATPSQHHALAAQVRAAAAAAFGAQPAQEAPGD